MNASGNPGRNPFNRLGAVRLRRGAVFGIIILTALLAFEIFNFSTTEYALSDLLGKLTFAGIRWATILSIAFCGIDFAGIARLFTPEQGSGEPTEVWYLFGAWMLAATMNAILTWWGVSMAIVNHTVRSSSVIDPSTLVKIVPVFVAVMVWLIRILIIGSLSYAGDRLFSQGERPRSPVYSRSRSLGGATASVPSSLPISNAMPRPAPKPVLRPETSFARPEPTYHSLSMSAQQSNRPAGAVDSTPNTRR
jgi:hypothetical protein